MFEEIKAGGEVYQQRLLQLLAPGLIPQPEQTQNNNVFLFLKLSHGDWLLPPEQGVQRKNPGIGL